MTRLLVQAAKGMYALLETHPGSGDLVRVPITLPYESQETLLVAFLSELLYYLEEDHLVFEAFDLALDGRQAFGHLLGRAAGTPVKEIKAVTYHNLEVVFTRQGCAATIVFDV
jgi:SHS2 domain-containing protein